MDGFVYLLGDRLNDGIYKIGKTRNDVEKRIKQLQTGNAGEIYLINKFKTKYPNLMEQKLHFKYSNNRERNEWFNLTYDDVSNFTNTCIKLEENIELLKDNPFIKKLLK